MHGTFGYGARREVRCRADVADDAAPRERAKQRGVLGGADAVRDPHGLEEAERLGNGVRTRPLARVRNTHQAEPSGAPERPDEITRRKGRLLAAEADPGGAWPRVPLVKVEDAVRRGGPPVPHDVEKDQDPAASRGFVRGKDALERRAHLEPVEPELLGDGRRDVDLGVADPLSREARR